MSEITDQPIAYSYVATAGQVAFAISCRVFADQLDAFEVTVNDEACTYNAAPTTNRQFSVTAASGDADGGTVTFGAGLTASDAVRIGRALPIERLADFPLNGPTDMDAVNDDLDRIVALIQDQAGRVARAPKAPIGETIGDLPALADRLGKYLAFDASGEPVASTGTGADDGLRADLAASSGTSLLAWLPVTGLSAVNLQTALRLSLPFHVEFFGAVGDGTTDDQAAIQATIDYVGSIGGGVVQFAAKTYRVDSTIDNKYPRVRLVGAGHATIHDSGNDAAKTLIYAPFAGTTLKIRTPYAAEQGITAANTFKYTGAGCTGIAFSGGGIGTKAVEIDSVSHIEVDVYATGYVGTTVYEMKCGVTGTDLGEACDIQYSRVILRARQIDTAGERASHILTLTGGTNANVSLNRGPHYGIDVVAQHWDGHVLVGVSADNNDISLVGSRPGGSGKLLHGHGRTASQPVGFEDNDLVFLSGAGASYLEGTSDAGVTAGVVNRISSRDTANGTPAPTAGTGSRWLDMGSNGVETGAANVGLVVADSAAGAIAELDDLGTGSLRIFNGSSNHAVLTDGTNSWSVALDGDDLRLLRLTGSGSLNLGNGAPVYVPSLTSAVDDAAAAAAGVAVGHLYRNGSVVMVRVV